MHIPNSDKPIGKIIIANIRYGEKMQTLSALLSWSHNTLLLDKVKIQEQIIWYTKQIIENGWSLSTLEYEIETKTYQRQAIAEKTANWQKNH